MSAILKTVPAPGLAVMPQYLKDQIQTFIIKPHTWTYQWEILDTQETPIFSIHSPNGTGKRKYRFINTNSKETLFQIRTEGWGMGHYTAKLPNGVTKLWDNEIHKRTFHSSTNTIQVANQADPIKGVVSLQYVSNGSRDASFLYNGTPVAEVTKISSFSTGTYRVTVSPGMDPTLVISLMIVNVSRIGSRATKGAFGGGSSFAGAAGGVASS